MPLNPGGHIGPYEVIAPIGAGGMGEVYKARDTRLPRVVAIKIISSLIAGAPELRERFAREAHTISQLNHPHICTLYDIGQDNGIDYLVLEYIEGESLAERLARGAMAPDEALPLAIQIADALDKAHRQHITHRDLKPANVMLTKSGAKLLDFGLAKPGTAAAAPFGPSASAPPTATTPVTARGSVLGTFQYMAPEQVEGAEADARTDIWAFGCVLYEMLTGKRAFEGKSHASLIGAILKDQPAPVSAVQPLTPPALDQIVRRCLAKDPEDRWQTARDLVLQLEWVQEGSAARLPAPAVRRRRWRERVAWSAALLLLAAAAIAYQWFNAPPEPRTVSFTVHPPDGVPFGVAPVAPFQAFSPDGRFIAFILQRGTEKNRLWIRAMDSVESRELTGTDDARVPFWSPDSRFVAFVADNKLKKIDVSGGSVQVLCDDVPRPEAGSWSRQGVILFVPNRTNAGGMFSIPAEGGQPTEVASLNALKGAFGSPSFLPDGRRFVFYHDGEVFLGSLDGGAPRRLFAADSRAQYVAPGFLLFARGQYLMAQPFDARKADVAGEAFPITDSIRLGINGRAAFSASDTGALVFRQGPRVARDAQLAWYDGGGNELGTIGATGPYLGPEVSPDRRRLSMLKIESNPSLRRAAAGEIWVLDLERTDMTRVTLASTDLHPIWSTDGRSLIFGSNRAVPGIYRKAASGIGTEDLVLRTLADAHPRSLASDGRTLLFDVAARDIWVGTLGVLDSARPLIANRAYNEWQPRLSPDGDYLAYTSTESGRPEVYIARFPDLGDRWTVSTTGGVLPRWAPDGRQLYFLKQNGPAVASLMVVDVRRDGRQLRFSQPKELRPLDTVPGDAYTVAADGRILAATRPVPRTVNQEPLTVLLNWPQARLTPAAAR